MGRRLTRLAQDKKEPALVLPLLWLLVLLPLWQLALNRGVVISNDIGVSDIADLQYPLRYFAGQQLRQGNLPLWTPGVYMGYPLLAEGQAGVFSPVNLLLDGLFPIPYALNVGSLLPFVLAATGAFLLARELGAGAPGGFLAGFAYAMSGFYVAHVKHIPIVATACWSPILLWLVERGVRRSDFSLLGAGLVLSVQWLSGSPQMAYYATGMAVLYFLARTWQTRGERPLRWIVPFFGLSLIMALGIAAVQLLPTIELVGFSERAGGVNFEFAARFPYAIENLKTFLYPLVNGTPGTGDLAVSSIFWEDYAYVGLIPLVLGTVGGLILARRCGVARLLWGLMAVTFLVVLGPNTPVFEIAYRIVPGLSFFRFPQRLWAFALLFLTLLAGLVLTTLGEWLETSLKKRKAKRPTAQTGARLLIILLLSLSVVDLYAYHLPWNAIVDQKSWLTPPETAREIKMRSGDGSHRVYTYDVYNTFRAAYREANGWRGDLEPYIAQREFLQPDLNLVYDIPTADGYVNLVPDCLAALWGTEKQQGWMDVALSSAGEQLQLKPGYAKLFSLYNVGFLITAQPLQDEDWALIGVYGPGAHLYENRQVLPRAYAVPRSVAVDKVQTGTLDDQGVVLELLAWMTSPAFDPSREVLLFGPATGPQSDPDTFDGVVHLVAYQPNRVALEAELNAPGWVVLSDTYYPGWEATVDGQPTPIYQANGCFRAVPVERAGTHEIQFRFRPKPFYRGALISATSGTLWLITLAWVLIRGRR
jgi:hypothetical protein